MRLYSRWAGFGVEFEWWATGSGLVLVVLYGEQQMHWHVHGFHVVASRCKQDRQ
jgi:hypothetical protein